MCNGTRLSHPADGRVYACPHCDGPRVRHRDLDKAVKDPDYPYYCADCKTGFSQPVDREKKENNGGGKKAKHGLARKLEEMSADKVGQEA